jgi:toxin ParE1/3/4
VKPARLRPAAEDDLVTKTQYFRSISGEELGASFFDEALKALGRLEKSPRSGSSRFGEWCGIPDLRTWRIPRFPVRWYYLERNEFLDVVRLLSDREENRELQID